MTNFLHYLKDEAEKAKKYAKQDGIKRIFSLLFLLTLLKNCLNLFSSKKLNPPVERRAKAISIKELDKDTEAAAKGIFIDQDKISDGINELQLYQKDTEEMKQIDLGRTPVHAANKSIVRLDIHL